VKSSSIIQYDIKQENRRIKTFRFLTDLTFQRLCIEQMTANEAWGAIDELRIVAKRMFPGKSEVFDLVIAPRLERVIIERFGETSITSN